MRLDFAFSVLSKGDNPLDIIREENRLKQEVGKLLFELGYEKFVVMDGDMIFGDVKEKINKHPVNE